MQKYGRVFCMGEPAKHYNEGVSEIDAECLLRHMVLKGISGGMRWTSF